MSSAQYSKSGERSDLHDPMPVRSLVDEEEAAQRERPFLHVYATDVHDNAVVCATDTVGYATPGDRSPAELVVDASEGFIPLWASDVTLRWRFQPQSMMVFRDPIAAAGYLRDLLGRALLLWQDAVPVRFAEVTDAWDFEISVSAQERCSINGCTLARAFFPDAGRHDLRIYPTMFDQPHEEQVETMAHELGHVFGLRHFFAQITEERWASEIFGKHQPFSIMNYGPKSEMTNNDRADLTLLYSMARGGELTEVNGTPIQLVRPFSAFRLASGDPLCTPAVAVRPAAAF